MNQMGQTYEINIGVEMKKSYLDYAMSVIIGRALPDIRDGLKPVHRRVLYAMREAKNDWNRAYKKSARIVGDVMGKYHPHGDSAIYDTIVRMAQDFSMRYQLVDGQGNFGSVDGDPPAAMRYTEIRMRRLAHEMMADIEKETVDFVPNYDESLTEPSVLPTKIPALIVNGSSGIAVGMATNIPPHNLSEVISALIALIDNPAIDLSGLMQHIPGPDFPTAGIIYGTQGIREAYESGRGIIRVRARAEIEEEPKTGHETIIVSELPYQVNKAALVEKIAELLRAKQLEGIRYVRDESDREGMRIAVGIKREAMGSAVLNQLFKHTRMETSFGVIFLAVVNGRPELLCLKDLLRHFVLHRKEIVIRRTRYDLKKAEERLHILEGLRIALDHIDEIIALIRAAGSPAEAKERLMERFSLSDIQAQAILDMRLQRLTGLERDKILSEHAQVLKDIAWFKEILGSESVVLGIIKEELLQIKEEFGDARRSQIVADTQEITLEDMITEEEMVVTVTRGGYIKRNPITLYQSQKRGGKGKTAMGTKEDDFVEHLFVASTHHTFLFFTNMGRVYWKKVYEIPQAGRLSLGKAVVNLLELGPDEKLTTILAVASFERGFNVFMATREGFVKKTDLMAFSRPRVGGIIGLGLKPGDELIAARITDGDMNVFLGTAGGKAIRFHENDVRTMGRSAQGVIGIDLAEGDRLVAMEVLSHGKTLFSFTENGFGKRTVIDEYPIQRRGGKGVITIKTSDRNGQVVAILLVDEDNDLMLMTNSGKLIRTPIEGISVISRNTQGVKLMGMGQGEKIIGAVRLLERDSVGEEETDDPLLGESVDASLDDTYEDDLDEAPEDPFDSDEGEPDDGSEA